MDDAKGGKTIMRALFIIGLLLMPLCAAHAQTATRIDITEFGIYTATVTKSLDAPGTAVGHTDVIAQINLAESTSASPGRLGVRFGFRYTASGTGSGQVTLTKLIHLPAPGIRNPQTGNVTMTDRSTIQTTLGANRYAGYSFDDAWEIVPGIWTVELWAGDRKLASQNFNIVKP
jgi:hypothetical protein